MHLANSSLTSVLFEFILHGQCVEAPRQAVHHVMALSKHPYATGPTLDMLTQSTEHYKLGGALRLLAPVYLILMGQALYVLIQPRECGER